jgi:hypothetical protein
MKHVRESLSQYYDYKFFKMFEEDDKAELKQKEDKGLKIIDKIIKNFEDFKKNANGEVIKFKEFWEENKKAKEMFPEPGAVYKMFDSDFAIGVLELPVKLDADGEIEGGFGASDEPEEEIIEGPELDAEENTEPEEDFFEEQTVPSVSKTVNEAEEGEEDLDLDLDLDLGDEGGEDLESPEEEPIDEPVDDMDVDVDVDVEDEPMTEPDEGVGLTDEPQTYLVVYDLSGGERDEIFRCGSTNVVNAFKDFYNDKFKGSMKNIIIQYKEQKAKEKAEAEKAEKKKAEKEKESKLDKFLGESLNNRKKEYIRNAQSLNEEYETYSEDDEDWYFDEGDRVIFDIKGMESEWLDDEETGELAISHDGQEAIIIGKATATEIGDKDYEYYDIEFGDGIILNAVSGYHLEEI